MVVLVTGSRSSCPLAAEQAFRRLSEQMRDRILRIAVGMADYDPAGTDAFASVGKVAALDEFGDIIGEPVERKLVFPVPEPGLLDKELQAACKAVAAAQIIDDDLPVFDDDFPGSEVILTAVEPPVPLTAPERGAMMKPDPGNRQSISNPSSARERRMNMTAFQNNYMDAINEVHLFFLLDTSGSMYGQRIQSLNMAMRNVAEKVDELAIKKEVSAFFHVLSFNSMMHWLCGTSASRGISGTELRSQWVDLKAEGGTETAAAIEEIIPALTVGNLGHHTFRPLVVLVTDGQSNRPADTVAAAMRLSEVLGGKTTRIAIGVVEYNQAELDSFASVGKVVTMDEFGDVIGEPVEQKLVFPVANAGDLTGVIQAAAVTSLVDNNRVEGDGIVTVPMTGTGLDEGLQTTEPDPYGDDDDDGAV